MTRPTDRLTDAQRLRALVESEMMGSGADAVFDRFTRLATRLVGAPNALMSFLDGTTQYFKSASGDLLGDLDANGREVPLADSVCPLVIRDDRSLAIEDAQSDARTRDIGAVHRAGLRGYLGVPVAGAEGHALGVLCVFGPELRVWSDADAQALHDLATCITTELTLRVRAKRAEAIEAQARASARTFRAETAVYRGVLDHMGDGVLAMDTSRRFLVVNSAARTLLAGMPHSSLPQDWPARINALGPDGLTPFAAEDGALLRATRGESVDDVEVVLRRDEGETFLNVASRPILDDAGEVSAGVAVLRDVTARKRLERSLREREHRFRLLSDASFEGIMLVENGRIADANLAAAEMFGFSRAELLGMNALELVPTDERPRVTELLAAPVEGAYTGVRQRKDGTRIVVEVRPRPLLLDGHTYRMSVFRDVTQEKENERLLAAQALELRTLSMRDELTGLHNRRGFLERGGQVLKACSHEKQTAALFFCDLNGMKAINDTLGHEEGDRALVEAARALQDTFDPTDVLARLGGDEFVVLAPEGPSRGNEIMQRRLAEYVAAWNLRGERFRLSISVGIARFDPHLPEPIEMLLGRADAQMYERKMRRRAAGGSLVPPPGA